MTIDPLTIPCPFCGEYPIVKDWRNNIYCKDCEISLTPEEWVEGGINALVGKLARQGIRIEDKSYGETPSWAWVTDEIWVKRGSFEEAVWDAWEKMKP